MDDTGQISDFRPHYAAGYLFWARFPQDSRPKRNRPIRAIHLLWIVSKDPAGGPVYVLQLR